VGVMIQVTETVRFHQQATAMNQELLLSVVRQHELAEVAERLNAQLQLEITEHKRAEQHCSAARSWHRWVAWLPPLPTRLTILWRR
jgi:hypothetical protein